MNHPEPRRGHVRPTGMGRELRMRRLMILLFAGAALAPLTACGADPPAGPPAATPGPATPGPGTSGPATPGSATPPPGAGEFPEGLPHGDRTLTGVVEESGGCLLLVVGTRRWALTGTAAEALAAGARVTVTGQVTTTGAGCRDPEVTRTLIVRRATPA